MVIFVGNEQSDACSNIGRGCVYLSANIIEKGMNPTTLYPAMDRPGSLILVWQQAKEKENSEFEPAKIRF